MGGGLGGSGLAHGSRVTPVAVHVGHWRGWPQVATSARPGPMTLETAAWLATTPRCGCSVTSSARTCTATDEHRHREVVLVESSRVLRRRRFHRQKLHLVLSGMRHLAAELGDRARYLRAETYREALEQVGRPVLVHEPTSHAAADLVRAVPQGGPGRRGAADADLRAAARRVRRVGRRPGDVPDGGLLPVPAAPVRRADGSRRAGRRQVELRPREPRAAAEGRGQRSTCPDRGSPPRTRSTSGSGPTWTRWSCRRSAGTGRAGSR